MENVNCTLSLAVMSGKGGVGKTNLSVNLGYGLFQQNNKVMLMDCDLGLANLDVLLGQSPEKNLQDLLDPNVPASDVLTAVEPDGFDFLPATSGVPELVDLDEDIQSLLLEKLKDMVGRYDFLLMDLGAGISRTVLAFAAMTHYKVVVITPEPTSLTDSYAMMKVLNHQHGVTDFHIIVNQVDAPDEGRLTFQRLHAACQRFLGLEIHYLGCVHHDSHVIDAVRRQVPFLKMAPDAQASQDIRQLAAGFIQRRTESMRTLSEQGVFADTLHQPQS